MDARDRPSNRVLVIGLDGGTLDLIEPWAKQGYLPTLAMLMQTGVYGRLRSTVPTISPPAWTSFMTGKNPGKHGVFDFVRRARGSYRLESVRFGERSARSFFSIMSGAGKRVAVINVPVTFPPEKLNGVMVSGLGAPDGGAYAYPPEYLSELRERGYRVNSRVHFAPAQEERFLRELYELSEQRAVTMLELMERQTWDFCMLVFRNVDEIQSFMWRYMDETHPLFTRRDADRYGSAILDYLKFLDRWISRLIAAMGEDAITLIMSDHGEGPLYRDVYLNNWLHEQGWLALKKPSRWSVQAWLRRLGITGETADQLLGWSNVVRLKRFLPRWFWQNMPKSYPTLEESVDWSRTKAYSFGYIGQIYVNLRGREPEGIVEPGEERQRLVSEIRQRLYALRDPNTGEKVVDAAYASEELYTGPCLDQAPDINVLMRDLSYITHIGRELASKHTFGPVSTYESATHRLEGMVILNGEGCRRGDVLREASIMDLAPTILHLMGLPVPEDMDGHVLTSVLTDPFRAAHPVVRCEPGPGPAGEPYTWSDDDEEALRDRLKGLGYLA